MVDSLRDRSTQVLLEQRDVVAVVDRPRLESELLAEEIEQVGERVHRRGNQVALEPRDRGLRGAGPVGELLLRQAVPATNLPKKCSRCHAPRISDLMYEVLDEPPLRRSGDPLERPVVGV